MQMKEIDPGGGGGGGVKKKKNLIEIIERVCI
jgi:hypothetical protein